MNIFRWFRFIPAILWMSLIFYLSGQPTTGVTGSSYFGFIPIYWQRFFILKFFHLVEYSTLFLLLHLAFGSAPKSILIGYLYACTDEFHQSFTPGRGPKFSDTLIDLTGLTIGYFIFAKIISPYMSKISIRKRDD